MNVLITDINGKVNFRLPGDRGGHLPQLAMMSREGA